MPDRERIGIFGGTFDPPHNGHVAVAANVRCELKLDRLLVVVNQEPWQKIGTRPMTPSEDRLALVEAAIDGLDGIEASRIEIDRPGPSFTVDTLLTLRRLHPDAVLFMVVGADAAAGLDSWERSDQLPELAELVVVGRPQSALPAIDSRWRTHVVEVPQLEVSSTEIRLRAAESRPLQGLVPHAVISCIVERDLYAGK